MPPKKVQNLRNKIAERTLELGIIPVWDNRGHHYKFPDSPEYRSVTSKLQVVKDEGLRNWYMNRACEYITENLESIDTDNPEAWEAFIKAAKQYPVTVFQTAGDIGTTVHDWREVWIKEWMRTGSQPLVTYPDDPRPEVKASVAGYVKAINDLRAEPVACELSLADRKLKVGGMLDDMWMVPFEEKIPSEWPTTGVKTYDDLVASGYKVKTRWELWLVDLKTSNIGNKNSYYMQVAAYWYMFRKLYPGIKIDKLFILNTSKEIFGDYDMIPLLHPERYFQMAKSAFKLSDDIFELEQLKKPVVASI